MPVPHHCSFLQADALPATGVKALKANSAVSEIVISYDVYDVIINLKGFTFNGYY